MTLLSKCKSIDENCHDRRACNWFCSLLWMDKTLLNYLCWPKQSFIALYTLDEWSSKSQYYIVYYTSTSLVTNLSTWKHEHVNFQKETKIITIILGLGVDCLATTVVKQRSSSKNVFVVRRRSTRSKIIILYVYGENRKL